MATIQVPRYGDPKVAQEVRPGARMDAPASLEAFGGGASNQAVFSAVAGTAKAATDAFEAERDQADAAAAQKAHDQTIQIRNRIMYGSGDGKDPGAISRKGEAAFGTMADSLPSFDKQTDEIEKNLGSQRQKNIYAQIRNKERLNLETSLREHISREAMSFQDSTETSLAERYQQDAAANFQTPGFVETQVKQLRGLMTARGARLGWGKEKTDQETADALAALHAGVIQRMTDSDDPERAAEYFEANKDALGKYAHTAKDLVERSAAIERGNAAWERVGAFRLADGTPDEGKMQEAILGDDSMTPQEREKAWDFVKAKAGEARAQKSREDSARDRSFLNSAISARKQNQPLESALKLAARFSIDPYDRALKEDAIKKMYSPEQVVTNPQKKIALWEGIQDGTVGRADIDAAAARGELSPSDHISLRQDYYNVVSEGKSPEMRRAHERVKLLAQDSFGKDPEAIASFLSEVQSEARGKTPDEFFKIATDKLKTDPATQHSFFSLFSWGGQEQYKSDLEKRNAESLAFGKADQDLGAETMKAISNSALRSGKKAFTPADFDAFTVEMGGYDKVKPGTAAYEAMQSLIKRNQLVTPRNIRKVLELYPDGKW